MTDSSTQTTTPFNTTLLMTASAGFMGVLGLGAALFPETILAFVGTEPGEETRLLVNVMGILYLSFAVVNWMARELLIGGIYGRPLTIGNFAHFFGASIALIKSVPGAPNVPLFSVLTAVYVLFAAGFGYVAFAGGQRCG